MPPKSNQEMRNQSISPNLHFYPNLRLMATCIPVCLGKENTQNRPKNQSEECIHEKFTLFTCMFWRQKSLLGKSANCPSHREKQKKTKRFFMSSFQIHLFPLIKVPVLSFRCVNIFILEERCQSSVTQTL